MSQKILKNSRIEIRISKEDERALEAKAEKSNMNKSEAIRYLIRKWIAK